MRGASHILAAVPGFGSVKTRGWLGRRAVAEATYSRISNGVMRWAAGELSNHIGRELSMLIWFVICGIAIIAMAHAHNGGLFIALAVIALGGWGPLFSLFPALGGVIAAWIYSATHSWTAGFHLAGAFAVAAGILSILLHPPGVVRRAEQRTQERRAA